MQRVQGAKLAVDDAALPVAIQKHRARSRQHHAARKTDAEYKAMKAEYTRKWKERKRADPVEGAAFVAKHREVARRSRAVQRGALVYDKVDDDTARVLGSVRKSLQAEMRRKR